MICKPRKIAFASQERLQLHYYENHDWTVSALQIKVIRILKEAIQNGVLNIAYDSILYMYVTVEPFLSSALLFQLTIILL